MRRPWKRNTAYFKITLVILSLCVAFEFVHKTVGSGASKIFITETLLPSAKANPHAPDPSKTSNPSPTHTLSSKQDEANPDTLTPPPEHPNIAHFPKAQLIAWTDQAPDSERRATRVTILETDFKYPLVRMTVRRLLDADGKVVELKDRQFMAADHLNIEKSSTLSNSEFSTIIDRSGGHILKQIGNSAVFIIAFDGRNPMALPKMIEQLQKEGAGKPEPDYIRMTRKLSRLNDRTVLNKSVS